MDFEQELKKFELSSVFTINFSWLKRYVELDNKMYVPKKSISVDEFREIESSFYALQTAWKAWREAKAQAAPEGFVLVKMDDLELLRDSALDIKYASLNNDSDRIFSDIEDIQLSIERLIELQEPTND